METAAKQNEDYVHQMEAKHKEVVDQLKRKNNDFEVECKRLMGLQNIIKTEKVSMEELKEGFHIQFKEAFAEKDKTIKELEGRNSFICKENEDLRIDMRKLVEASYNKDSSILMMEKSIKGKTVEISNLRSEQENTKQSLTSTIYELNDKDVELSNFKNELSKHKQMLVSMIEKQNLKLARTDSIIQEKADQLLSKDLLINRLKEERKPESDKRLN